MRYIFIFVLLTLCSNAETIKTPAKIEHITRNNITERYKFESNHDPEDSKEEPIFKEEEFYDTSAKNFSQKALQLSTQEEIEKLARMKRAGRLSQKDYLAKVAAIHEKKKKAVEVHENDATLNSASKQHPSEQIAKASHEPLKHPETPSEAPKTSFPVEQKPTKEVLPSEDKIESLKIHPNDEIWDEE